MLGTGSAGGGAGGSGGSPLGRGIDIPIDAAVHSQRRHDDYAHTPGEPFRLGEWWSSSKAAAARRAPCACALLTAPAPCRHKRRPTAVAPLLCPPARLDAAEFAAFLHAVCMLGGNVAVAAYPAPADRIRAFYVNLLAEYGPGVAAYVVSAGATR